MGNAAHRLQLEEQQALCAVATAKCRRRRQLHRGALEYFLACRYRSPDIIIIFFMLNFFFSCEFFSLIFFFYYVGPTAGRRPRPLLPCLPTRRCHRDVAHHMRAAATGRARCCCHRHQSCVRAPAPGAQEVLRKWRGEGASEK